MRLTRSSTLAFVLAVALAGCSRTPEAPANGGSTTASPRTAGDKLALTIENIQGAPNGARQAAIAPDGQTVAFTASPASGARGGIHLVSTAIPARDPSFWVEGASPVWFPDGKRLLFTRDNDLWSVAVGSSDAVQVTKGGYAPRDAAVSPDGASVAFYSLKSAKQDIWTVPADGSAEAKVLVPDVIADDDFRYSPAWSPDGKSIAYVSYKAGYWDDDVWVVDVASGKTRQVSKGLMAMSTPAWSPDGKSLALLGVSKKGFWYEDLSDIYIVDAASGAERVVKMQVFATDFLQNLPVIWSGDGKQLYFLYHERGDLNLWSVPAAGGVATRITNDLGMARSVTATRSADAFAWVRSNPTRGPEVEYVGAGGGPVRQLTRLAPTWDNVSAPIEIAYRSFDGLYIQGFLYLPPDMKEGQKYPALVQVHGGGTNSYYRGQNLMENYFASRGYVVMAINYRGGSGFGRTFQDLSINDWVNGQAHDAAVAADFMRSLPYVNGKVGIYGYSYGGIMSLGTIARYPDKYDAAVPMAGIYDFADAYTNADRLGKIFLKTGHGGAPEDRKEIYAISNTLTRVQNIQTPLLLMHGEADVRAPFRQYQLALEILKKHGKTFESKSYPDEPHGFRNPANRIDMYKRAEAFLDKYLKNSGTSKTE